MSGKTPIRVALMDDDFSALQWNAHLLSRDLRTTVSLEAESPEELLLKLHRHPAVDIVLLDVEYLPEEPTLQELMGRISAFSPAPAVICLSQYGGEYPLEKAIQSGARGFLLKNEVRMAISSAVMLALEADFLISPGVIPWLNEIRPQATGGVVRMKPWVVHPAFSAQLKQVFTLKVLYGMSAPLTAQEVFLTPGTVEKYMQYAYQKLSQRWGDERLLEGIEADELSPEAWAFHLYTLPPA